MSNSVDPDETPHDEPSHLDLCWLQKPIIIAYGRESVKESLKCHLQMFTVFTLNDWKLNYLPYLSEI